MSPICWLPVESGPVSTQARPNPSLNIVRWIVDFHSAPVAFRPVSLGTVDWTYATAAIVRRPGAVVNGKFVKDSLDLTRGIRTLIR